MQRHRSHAQPQERSDEASMARSHLLTPPSIVGSSVAASGNFSTAMKTYDA